MESRRGYQVEIHEGFLPKLDLLGLEFVIYASVRSIWYCFNLR
jgi:hypothetical protein